MRYIVFDQGNPDTLAQPRLFGVADSIKGAYALLLAEGIEPAWHHYFLDVQEMTITRMKGINIGDLLE